MILKYTQFLEKYNITPTTPTEVATLMNRYNDLEDDIRDFPGDKFKVASAVEKSKTEEERVKNLAAAGVLDKRTANKKELSFENPLVGMTYRQEVMRKQISDLEKKSTKKGEELKNIQGEATANPSQAGQKKQEEQDVKSSIQTYQKNIEDLKDEVVDQENDAKKELKHMQAELKDVKAKIDFHMLKSPNP